eukprot:g3762.t1
MGICSSSPSGSESSHHGQSEAFRKIIMSSVQTETSVPPALNLEEREKSNIVDGLIMSELFRAGFVALHRNKDLLNRINVFPIPDGDTGSNMCITLRDAVKSLDREKNLMKVTRKLITRALDAGKSSLARSPDELVVNGKKILKGKGVVDSGAQGFVLILQGMMDAINGTLIYGDYLAQDRTSADVAFHSIHHDDDGCCESLKYRFCTECVAELDKDVSKDTIVSDLDDLGDSVAVQIAEMGKNVRIGKIHIHSNDPEQVFDNVRSHCKDGVLFKEKSEDMMKQTKLKNHKRGFQPRERVLRSGKRVVRCGVLWTSMNPAPDDFIDRFREGWVPLNVVVDVCLSGLQNRNDTPTEAALSTILTDSLTKNQISLTKNQSLTQRHQNLPRQFERVDSSEGHYQCES